MRVLEYHTIHTAATLQISRKESRNNTDFFSIESIWYSYSYESQKIYHCADRVSVKKVSNNYIGTGFKIMFN